MINKYIKRMELQDDDGLVIGYRSFIKSDWLVENGKIRSLQDIVIDVGIPNFIRRLVIVFDDDSFVTKTVGGLWGNQDICVSYLGDGYLDREDKFILQKFALRVI